MTSPNGSPHAGKRRVCAGMATRTAGRAASGVVRRRMDLEAGLGSVVGHRLQRSAGGGTLGHARHHDASLDRLRKILVDMLDQHDVSRAILCGTSLGGLVALDVACHRPDRVEALVISGCPGLGKTPNLGLRRGGDMFRQNADLIADRLFYDRSAISEAMIEKSFAIARDRRCAVNMLRYIMATRNYDVRKSLQQIQCEVLLVWGAHDEIAPVEDWEQNLHLIAKASLHKLARCGHSPMIERPVEFNAILVKFMLGRG